jgi:hypothetical protein
MASVCADFFSRPIKHDDTSRAATSPQPMPAFSRGNSCAGKRLCVPPHFFPTAEEGLNNIFLTQNANIYTLFA